MKEVMAGMSDETIVALARYYAAQAPAPRAAPVQQEKYRLGEQTSKRMLCGTCHLPDYSGQNPVPRLAGSTRRTCWP